jgi:hypothetical protein
MWRLSQARLLRITASVMALFGYWITIQDAASARYAVRMAGLPVLLIAANALLAAMIMAMTLATLDAPMGRNALTILGLLVAAGIALGGIAFALRAGRATALVPAATALSIAAFAVQAVASPPWMLIVPSLALLLALSGLRGWFWLRRHPP